MGRSGWPNSPNSRVARATPRQSRFLRVRVRPMSGTSRTYPPAGLCPKDAGGSRISGIRAPAFRCDCTRRGEGLLSFPSGVGLYGDRKRLLHVERGSRLRQVSVSGGWRQSARLAGDYRRPRPGIKRKPYPPSERGCGRHGLQGDVGVRRMRRGDCPYELEACPPLRKHLDAPSRGCWPEIARLKGLTPAGWMLPCEPCARAPGHDSP